MQRFLMVVAFVIGGVSSASAATTVTYSTTGSQLCVGASGCGVNSQTIGGAVNVTLSPVGSSTVIASPTTFASFGEIVVSCVGGGTACGNVSLNGLNVFINISQTLPSAGFASIVGGVFSGTLSGTASSARITWNASTSAQIGIVHYGVAAPTLALAPPSVNGGVTSVQAVISEAPLATDNTTCATANFLFPGIGSGQSIDPGASRYYKVAVVAKRSYSLYSWAPFQDAGEGGAMLGHALFTNNSCSVAAAGVSTGQREPSVVLASHTGDSDTIIPTFTGTLYVQVTNGGASSHTVNTLFQETTAFSPWWFAAGGYNAFAELKNTTNTSVAYVLTAYANTGTVCGSAAGTLAAEGNIGINIRTLGTCQAAASGSAQVAFQGASGALIGNITTIDGVQGISFDAPFTPRMAWSASMNP